MDKKKYSFFILFLIFLIGFTINLIDYFAYVEPSQLLVLQVISYPILLLAGYYYVNKYSRKISETNANKKTLTGILSFLGGINFTVLTVFLFFAYILRNFGGSSNSTSDWIHVLWFQLAPFLYNTVFIMYAFNWYNIKISLIKMLAYQVLAVAVIAPLLYVIFSIFSL